MTAFTIDFSSITSLTDDQFDRLCAENPEIKLERTPAGELVIMSPTGGETGKRNAELISDLVVWNRMSKLGVVFDSSTCFRLPNGGDRSPDVSWIERSRWETLTPEQQRKFPPICPDFVLELMSPSDNLTTTRNKMQEYLASGVRLGWMIDSENRKVEIYRSRQVVETLLAPAELLGELVLPGFILNLDWFWRSPN